MTHLSLVDFRSYASAEVALEPGPTAIVGRNGQGKTNLVEALGYTATLASHRVATDAPLVRAGAPRAVVRTAVDRAGRSTLVELEITPGRANRARVNRAPLPRPRDVLGHLRMVLFAPEDLALVKGDPDGRRRFCDEVLVALAPRLAGVRADYERVVRQRSALLRSATALRPVGGRRRGSGPARPGAPSEQEAEASALATLDVWDEQLAATGAELLSARLHLVRRLAPHAAWAYAAVSGREPVADAAGAPVAVAATVPQVPPDGAGRLELGYRGSLPLLADVRAGDPDSGPLPPRAVIAAALLEQARASRREEVERGTTLVGPHRDDLVLTLDDLPARGYASHGESWSCALALRLGTYALLRGGADPGTDPEVEPVLVLDDVFAELDAGRRARLAGLVAGAEQVLVTAAVVEDLPAGLAGRRLHVRDGAVT